MLACRSLSRHCLCLVPSPLASLVGANSSSLRDVLPAPTSVSTVQHYQQLSTSSALKSNKHWDRKWAPLRRLKVIKVDLPNFQEDREAKFLTPEQIRSKLKERGVAPPRPWVERQVEFSATGGFFDAYVPPEGDGKASLISATGAKQTAVQAEKKTRTMMALRKIKSFEEGFDKKDFLDQALDIYKNMHETMVKASGSGIGNNERDLAQYVTEKAYPEVINNLKCKTLRWKFLKSVEPAKLVHARCDNLLAKDNTFGQITVRFHTKQTLAIYDRFGRLMFGNELVAKDVLEYVVFEKHLADTYGTWRVHGKVIPDWAGTGYQLVGKRTVRVPPEQPDQDEKVAPVSSESTSTPAPATTQQPSESTPAIAAV